MVLSLGYRASMVRIACLSVFLMAASVLADTGGSLEIIPMKYRPADILVREIRPLAPADMALSASGNNLIVRGSPDDIAELKLLIDVLDQPLAQFKISIKSDGNDSLKKGGVSYRHSSDHLNTGPKITTSRDGLTVTRTTNNATSEVVVRRSSSASRGGTNQQVRATEGYPAYVGIGKKVPVTTLLFSSSTHQPIINQQYEPVISGFYVTPQLVNDRELLLSLSTQKQALKHNNQIDVQNYSGTVRGRLNEWILIAGVGESTNRQESSNVRRYQSDLSRANNIYLKVERVR